MSRNASRRLVAAAVVAAGLVTALPAAADEYNPRRAGHPLRIIAYGLHPFGVAVDYLVMRPLHWLGHTEPLRVLFGHKGERYGER